MKAVFRGSNESIRTLSKSDGRHADTKTHVAQVSRLSVRTAETAVPQEAALSIVCWCKVITHVSLR